MQQQDNHSEEFELTVEKDSTDVDSSSEKKSHDGHHHHHHHHHSHHRSHGRSKKYKGRNRKKESNKFLLFLKHNRSKLINVFCCLLALTMLLLYAANRDGSDTDNIETPISLTSGTIQIETCVYSQEVQLASAAVKEYITTDITSHDAWSKHKGYATRLDQSQPFEYRYSVSGLPEGVWVTDSELRISESEKFSEYNVYYFPADSKSLSVYNLKSGTEYFYQLVLRLSDGSSSGAIGSFTTENYPRMLTIDGLVNVRDIGGWVGEDGKTVKQGLLFRGSELDGAVEPNYCLTESGREELLRLGIRYDMDLRSEAEASKGKYLLTGSVTHKTYGVTYYSDIFDVADHEAIRCVFSDLADESNYPIYLHCTYGRDRTGTICYLLESLLGVSDSDLRKDYDLSALYDGYVDTEAYIEFITRINMLEGETTQQKVEGYLLSIGVTQEEIQSIKNIFLN